MKKRIFIVLLLIGSILFNPIIAFASAYINDVKKYIIITEIDEMNQKGVFQYDKSQNHFRRLLFYR